MRPVTASFAIVAAFFVGGCLSVTSVESNWIITSSGTAATALPALGRAAHAAGGTPLADPSPVSMIYRFGSSIVSFRISGADIAVLATTPTSSFSDHAEPRAEMLLNKIISRAGQDTGLALQLKPAPPSAMPALASGSAEDRIGITSVNPRFAAYGLYLQRMAKAVDHAWEEAVAKTTVYPPVNTSVVVTFLLDPHGRIARIVNVDLHSSPLGATLALTALTSVSSYGEWSPDMEAALHPEGEELTFTFYYQ